MSSFRNRSILAAMAGITDGNFAKQCLKKGGAGMGTIGGYPIGKEMILASSKIAQRGREEFILNSGEEHNEILNEAKKVGDFSRLIINLRLNSPEEANKFARNFGSVLSEKPIIEINAHCRQLEISHIGGGQKLLQRFEVLTEIIKAFQSKSFEISLKIRGNAINPYSLIPQIEKWHLDFLHIDSYKEGTVGTDLDMLEIYTTKTDVSIIGNNSVVDFTSAQAILDTGAQYFSIARAARTNQEIFNVILKHF